MRQLLYVPILHTEPDLGSEAASLDRQSSSLLGEERWAKHKVRVARFWESIAGYLAAIDASTMKIYQDGLPAGGALGKKIIEEGARRGSRNHQLLLSLMARGAEIRKTEDAPLLKEEYDYIAALNRSGSAGDSDLYRRYRLRKNRLTEERDRFIAGTIGETLQDGETGILFIGSYHNILPYLPRDIKVTPVKDREKINAYFRELISGADEPKLERLAEDITRPD